jgi:hypothetical protein
MSSSDDSEGDSSNEPSSVSEAVDERGTALKASSGDYSHEGDEGNGASASATTMSASAAAASSTSSAGADAQLRRRPTASELVTAEGALAACVAMLKALVEGHAPDTSDGAVDEFGMPRDELRTARPTQAPPNCAARHVLDARRLLMRASVG